MTILQVAPVVVLWAVVLVRIIGMGFGWKPGILFAIAAVDMSSTLNIDQVYLSLDSLLGGWNVLNLVVHLLMGLGLTEMSRLLFRATSRSTFHVKVLLCIGILMAVVQVALLEPALTQGSATNFTEAFGAIPQVAVYQASFFAWAGIVLGYTGVVFLRRSRGSETALFRIGFDIIGVGCLSGLSAVVMKLVMVGFEITAVDPARDNYVLYRFLIAVTLCCFAVGFLLPSYGRMKNAIRGPRRIRQALSALSPIVARLEQTPACEALLGPENILFDGQVPKMRLYRWLIFVNDIKLLNPELLSAQEHLLIDEIGRDFAHTSAMATV